MWPTSHEAQGAQRLRLCMEPRINHPFQRNTAGWHYVACCMTVELSGYSTLQEPSRGESHTACKVLHYFEHKLKFNFYPRRPRYFILIYSAHFMAVVWAVTKLVVEVVKYKAQVCCCFCRITSKENELKDQDVVSGKFEWLIYRIPFRT
jgi:hypothetical protein